MKPKDLLLAPIYLYQGTKLKRNVIRLPEADGERYGSTLLSSSPIHSRLEPDTNLNLMIVGDSSAAGVGVKTQAEALAGQLLKALQKILLPSPPSLLSQYNCINWSLHATTGHTSFDILRRLYTLPTPTKPIDIMIVVVGVNDATTNTSTAYWQTQLKQIIAIAKRKFNAKHIIFSSLPPMDQMPALPAPLSHFMGAKAAQLDQLLQDVCQESSGVSYFGFNLDLFIKDNDTTKWFATDGFHPSALTYEQWGKQLAEYICDSHTCNQHHS